MEFLRVSENQRFLVTESGRPFYWLGDTAWELFHRLTREEAVCYLDNRAAKGFNIILAVILAERDGLHTPNAYGHLPLYDDDPTRLQAAYFAYIDEVIRLAESRGLYIGLLPTWGDKVDLVGGIGPVIFNVENAYSYGELLGTRYRHQPNLIWILGGDRYPDDFEAIWRAMALGIRTGTHDHALISYHPRGPGQSSTRLHDEAWLSFNMIQSGHAQYDVPNWAWIAQDYACVPTKPTLDGEPNYEHHPVGFQSDVRFGRFTDYDVRKAAYRAMLSGACGHTYGHHSIWQMYNHSRTGVLVPELTWREALDAPGAGQMIHLRRLIELHPLSRIPCPEMVSASTLPLQPCASRDDEGHYVFVYLPAAGQSVTLNLTFLAGSRFKAWWYDPRTGHSSEIAPFDRCDHRTFRAPTHGMDWVLVVNDIEFALLPPGLS